MGAVSLAEDTMLERKVAFKFLPSQASSLPILCAMTPFGIRCTTIGASMQ
jgi:hypothetical protein